MELESEQIRSRRSIKKIRAWERNRLQDFLNSRQKDRDDFLKENVNLSRKYNLQELSKILKYKVDSFENVDEISNEEFDSLKAIAIINEYLSINDNFGFSMWILHICGLKIKDLKEDIPNIHIAGKISRNSMGYVCYLIRQKFTLVNASRCLSHFDVEKRVIGGLTVPIHGSNDDEDELDRHRRVNDYYNFYTKDIKQYTHIVFKREFIHYEFSYEFVNSSTTSQFLYDQLFVSFRPSNECKVIVKRIENKRGGEGVFQVKSYVSSIPTMREEDFEKNSITCDTKYGIVIIPIEKNIVIYKGTSEYLSEVKDFIKFNFDIIRLETYDSPYAEGEIDVVLNHPMVKKIVMPLLQIKSFRAFWFCNNSKEKKSNNSMMIYFDPSILGFGKSDNTSKVNVELIFDGRFNDTMSKWKCVFKTSNTRYFELFKSMFVHFLQKFNNICYDSLYGKLFKHFFSIMYLNTSLNSNLSKTMMFGNVDKRTSTKLLNASSEKFDSRHSRKTQGKYRPIMITKREVQDWEYFIREECVHDVDKITRSKIKNDFITEFGNSLFVEYNPHRWVGVHKEGNEYDGYRPVAQTIQERRRSSTFRQEYVKWTNQLTNEVPEKFREFQLQFLLEESMDLGIIKGKRIKSLTKYINERYEEYFTEDNTINSIVKTLCGQHLYDHITIVGESEEYETEFTIEPPTGYVDVTEERDREVEVNTEVTLKRVIDKIDLALHTDFIEDLCDIRIIHISDEGIIKPRYYNYYIPRDTEYCCFVHKGTNGYELLQFTNGYCVVKMKEDPFLVKTLVTPRENLTYVRKNVKKIIGEHRITGQILQYGKTIGLHIETDYGYVNMLIDPIRPLPYKCIDPDAYKTTLDINVENEENFIFMFRDGYEVGQIVNRSSMDYFMKIVPKYIKRDVFYNQRELELIESRTKYTSALLKCITWVWTKTARVIDNEKTFMKPKKFIRRYIEECQDHSDYVADLPYVLPENIDNVTDAIEFLNGYWPIFFNVNIKIPSSMFPKLRMRLMEDFTILYNRIYMATELTPKIIEECFTNASDYIPRDMEETTDLIDVLFSHKDFKNRVNELNVYRDMLTKDFMPIHYKLTEDLSKLDQYIYIDPNSNVYTIQNNVNKDITYSIFTACMWYRCQFRCSNTSYFRTDRIKFALYKIEIGLLQLDEDKEENDSNIPIKILQYSDNSYASILC